MKKLVFPFLFYHLLLNYKPVNYINFVVGVKNLFNQAYYEHLNRKIVGSTLNLFEPDRSFFFILS